MVGFLVGAGAMFAVTVVVDDDPKVTVRSKTDMPETREGLIAAWTAELKKAGKEKPDGWEGLTTGEIRDRYLSQYFINAPDAEDIDPDMVVQRD
ncbi:hypothetical protein [Streptomyces niveus]|uniref:Uncharacterized protein n=1 Tax=Streptomyces niveus TaxID=193462 RepID=A0A1U9R1U7_STRNV|nr:hypothetical protein [Streptomyces niveus]AQU70476.1 hypothetical protein BBN63_34235 [Streptomyces niveus]